MGPGGRRRLNRRRSGKRDWGNSIAWLSQVFTVRLATIDYDVPSDRQERFGNYLRIAIMQMG